MKYSDDKEKFLKIMGSNIRFERKKRDLTIAELSELLDIAPGFLGLIERGKRGTSISNIVRIAEFFNVTLEQLLCNYLDPSKAIIAEQNSNISKKKKEVLCVIKKMDEIQLDFLLTHLKGLVRYTRGTHIIVDNEKCEY